MLSSSIAVSKAGTTVLRWKSKPGPATSARAPKACALKALDTYPKVLEKNRIKNCISLPKMEVYMHTKEEDGPAWARYEAKQQQS